MKIVNKCISIKSLFETFGSALYYGEIIEVTKEDNPTQMYYDLKGKDGTILCLDGEVCQVAYDALAACYRIENYNDSIPTVFRLSTEEGLVAFFE